MRVGMRTAIALFVILPVCLAQQSPAIQVNVRLVNVAFTVRDAGGKLVTNLTKDDFEVLDDGQPQPISFFARGGSDFDAQADDLRTSFREIGEQLRSSYELAYHANGAADGTFHKLVIRTKQPGYTVRAKAGYFSRDNEPAAAPPSSPAAP
jgi:hypothetical protein